MTTDPRPTYKELRDSLEETRRVLAYVVFLSIKNHPNPEAVADIERVLLRARTAIDRYDVDA